MYHVLHQIICDEFVRKIGRRQTYSEGLKTAMRIDFSTKDGPEHKNYTHTELVLFAPLNYVGVYTRNYWTPQTREGTKGETPWRCLCYHDSCWRDEVHNFLFQNRDEIQSLALGDWYTRWELTDQEIALFREIS